MIAWIALKLGLSQLLVKVILFAAVSGGIFLCLRWYGNRQYYEGQKDGRSYAIDELKKAKEAEWKAKDAAIAQATETVANERKQLEMDRATLTKSLRDGIAASRTERGRINATVNSIPDSERNSSIRSVLRQLAAD